MHKKAIEAAHTHLKKDARFKKIIGKYKLDPYRRPADPFASLLKSIVYQQLSGKAAGTILARFLAYFPGGKPTPQAVLKIRDAQFRKAGLSAQKTKYLKDLAKRFLDGTIEPKRFPKMTDEEIREHLLVVKGIGRWTADMFLMFTLKRPDVLPTGDLGIQKGFQRVFGMRKLPSPAHMEKLAQEWSPHRTVASLYLWRTVNSDDTGDW